MGPIVTSTEFGSKILDILGVDSSTVTSIAIVMEAGEIARCRISRYITTEEADEIASVIKDENYCLMRLKSEESEGDEESKESEVSEEKD